ncbi:MAG: serine hydrolase domain-containing protein [Gemmatimonadales bacterium]
MGSPARWMGRLLAAAALAGLHAGALAGQGAVPDSMARRLNAVFARYDRPNSPGCTLGVYRDGRVVYAKGYGSGNLELGAPLTPASVFDIGSTSKQFTAMSVLLLAREGKLGLDDEVRRYVPSLPSYGAPITIRHLLHHTSGIRDYTTLFTLAGERTENWTTDDDALDLIVRQRALNFPPGSQWQYSNSGYFLLSLVVERVSGQSLRRFAHARIFQPLGMTHSHFHDDHGMVVPNRATGYVAADSAGPFRIEMSDFEQTGDGSVFTTVEDLLQWDENFYSARVGGPAVLARMIQPGKLDGGDPLDYAAGLFVGTYRGLQTVEHGGSWAGYRSQLLRFPTQHVSVACLCNLGTADPDGLAQEVADIYLADRLGPRDGQAEGDGDSAGASAVTLPPERLRAAVGTYRDSTRGAVARIVLAGRKLELRYSGAAIELRPVSATEFRPIGFDARLRLVPGRSGSPRRISLSGPGLGETTFEAIVPVRPSAAGLDGLVGEYFSPELRSTYRIVMERGALVLHARNLPTAKLEPTLRDEFEYPVYGLTLRFTRRAGRVDGFTLAAGRTQGLRFERRSR